MSRLDLDVATAEAIASRAATPTRRRRPPSSLSATELEAWHRQSVQRLSDLLAVSTDRMDGKLIMAGRADDLGPAPAMITLSTDDGDIPCWLLTPASDRRLDAAVIAVAGHGPGIDALVEPSPNPDDFHGGLAHKLVAAGYTVLCPEMISFGRRRTPLPATAPPAEKPAAENSCQVDAMRGLLLGRPVLGRRVADTLAALRAVRALDGIDPAKVAVVGGSGGGAVTMLTTALDEHIPAAVVGAFFSSFAASFCSVPHCICNAVPDLLTWFEMADIATMIAPRRLIIEAGRHDPIFPVEAAESAYEELAEHWTALGTPPPDLVITDAGHQFRADQAIALLREHLPPDR